jgi:hypothetical protein
MYIWLFDGDTISWPALYAQYGASGESLTLETGLAANFRIGSQAASEAHSSSMSALGRIAAIRDIPKTPDQDPFSDSINSSDYRRYFLGLRLYG